MNTITNKLAEALRLLDNVTAAQDSEADYLGQAENLLRQALAEYDARRARDGTDRDSNTSTGDQP